MKKPLLISGLTLALFESMIFYPRYALWIAIGIVVVAVIGVIRKHNTSYSQLLTILSVEAAILTSVLVAVTPLSQQTLAIGGALLTLILLDPKQKGKTVEAQGRNETISQRLLQAVLLGVLYMWYNAVAQISDQLDLIDVIQVIAVAVSTGLITFHFHKTIAADFQRSQAIIGTLLVTFLVAQTSWITQLWPFTYTTRSLILLAVTFFLWTSIELDIKRTMSLKRIAPSMTIALLTVLIAIISGPWEV